MYNTAIDSEIEERRMNELKSMTDDELWLNYQSFKVVKGTAMVTSLNFHG